MKYGRFLRILTMTSILSLLLLALTVTPALAAGNFEITPKTGTIGDSIEIYGYGFNPSTQIRIYFAADAAILGDSLNTDVDTYQRIYNTFTVPADGTFIFNFQVPSVLNEGSDDETVTTGPYYIYATPSASTQIIGVGTFTVESPGKITLVDPDEGQVDSEIEITGTGFDSREYITVEYDGDEIDIKSGDRASSSGEFTATIIVPESTAGDHIITVTGDTSGITATDIFTVEPAITLTPASGPPGTTVTVSGTGFGDRSNLDIIEFDGDDIATSGDDDTDSSGNFDFTFAVPATGSGSYTVAIEDEDNNSAEAEFTIAAAVITVNPTSGYAGIAISVNGTGFQASKSITITFDNTNITTANSDANGSFNTSFAAPSRTTGTYKIRASDGTNTVEGNFEIGISTTITPTTSATAPGYVGTKVSISGIGYTAGAALTVKYDTEQVATTIIGSDGTFSVTFNVPVSKGGAHTINVTDNTNTRQFAFFLDSTPPSYPVPLKPEMGVELKEEVYFDWENVTDPSGVTYALQIATSEAFSGGSILLEETAIKNSDYTLATLDILKPVEKEKPYYWHVRAIDGASNTSEWSGTGTFYIASGFSLSQTTIYTIIGIVAFVFALFAFWLGRKTSYY